MKSAYEIALERLEKASGPVKKLTQEQRTRIVEIEKSYETKIAESKLAYEPKIAAAASPDEREKIRAELAETIASLESERDKKKDMVWHEG